MLVVDDNVDAADSLTPILRLHGHEVRSVRRSARLVRGPPIQTEVAFIDLDMPWIDGLDLARALRAEPWSDRLRLVAVPGMGQKSDMQSTSATGFDAHLAKPAQRPDILRLAGRSLANVVALRPDRAAKS